MIQIHTFCGGFDSNFSYVIVNENEEAIFIDPFISKEIDEELQGLKLKYIINTHTHTDHTEGNDHYKKYFGGKIITHKLGSVEADIKVDDNSEIDFGKEKLKFIYTPGHSPHSMCILLGDKLFTGDTLFVGCVGNTNDPEQLKASLNKLMRLPPETIIYPGHDYGSTSTSTIEKEKKENPFM